MQQADALEHVLVSLPTPSPPRLDRLTVQPTAGRQGLGETVSFPPLDSGHLLFFCSRYRPCCPAAARDVGDPLASCLEDRFSSVAQVNCLVLAHGPVEHLSRLT
jgi:hypothetical protein